jgi:peptide/nickel transport system permease protein
MSVSAGTIDGPSPAAPAARNEPRAAHPFRDLLVWRVPLGVLSVVFVAIVTYLATEILPGDAATAILGQSATPARIAILKRQLGLNQSLLGGLWHWISGYPSGRFGSSLVEQRPVTQVVFPVLTNSLVLVVAVAILSSLIGIVTGVLAANRRDGIIDHVWSTIALVATALPEFVVGVFVVLLFSVGLFHWFPAVSTLNTGQHIWNAPNKAILPVLTLTIVTTPYMFRMVRAAMIEALRSDYIEVAKLKGVPPRSVLFRHALPNAIAPAIQVFGLNVLYLAGGIVVVETVFQYPGIGLTLVNSIDNRDVPTIQFIVVLLAIFYVTLNIVTDVAVLAVTPRRRAPR